MTELFTTAALGVLVVSFLIGIVVGLTGMGGGALMTPALIFLGIPPTAAVANDLVAAAVNRSVGAAVHWRSGSADLRLMGWLVAGSVPAALVGAFALRFLAPLGDPESWLKLAIGATLLLTAGTFLLRMYLNLLRPAGRARSGGDNGAGTSRPPDVAIRPVPTLLVGVAGGLLVGLTSVGAGSLMMVALLLIYPRLTMRRLVGTDLIQAIPLVIAAAIGHVIVSGVDWAVLIPLIVGGSPGTYLGAKLAVRVPQGVIRRGIVLVLTLTALTLLRVPPGWVGASGALLVILGPVAWSVLRDRTTRRRAEPPADDGF